MSDNDSDDEPKSSQKGKPRRARASQSHPYLDALHGVGASAHQIARLCDASQHNRHGKNMNFRLSAEIADTAVALGHQADTLADVRLCFISFQFADLFCLFFFVLSSVHCGDGLECFTVCMC